MAHTEFTLALDESWDLMVGDDGEIVTKKGDSATFQNVANECRCSTDDLYFDVQRGIPWLKDHLGQKIQASLLSAQLRKAALSVEGVQSVEDVELTQLDADNREVHGVIKVLTNRGTNGNSEF